MPKQVGLGGPWHEVHAGREAQGLDGAALCSRRRFRAVRQCPQGAGACRCLPLLPARCQQSPHCLQLYRTPGKWSAWMLHTTVVCRAASAATRPRATWQLRSLKAVPRLQAAEAAFAWGRDAVEGSLERCRDCYLSLPLRRKVALADVWLDPAGSPPGKHHPLAACSIHDSGKRRRQGLGRAAYKQGGHHLQRARSAASRVWGQVGCQDGCRQ